jgi:hypothetical protein
MGKKKKRAVLSGPPLAETPQTYDVEIDCGDGTIYSFDTKINETILDKACYLKFEVATGDPFARVTVVFDGVSFKAKGQATMTEHVIGLPDDCADDIPLMGAASRRVENPWEGGGV